MSERIENVVLVLVIGALIGSIVGCVYQQEVTLPLKMADKGWCFTPYPGRPTWQGFYAPCVTKTQETPR